MTRIIYTQHAQTQWNAERKSQGHTDTPLNDFGRATAQRLAGALTGLGITRIYTSDLQRTIQTAQPFAERSGLEILRDKRLRERRSDRAHPTTEYRMLDWPAHWPYPETDEILQKRMNEVMHEIASRNTGETVLVISHGAASRQFIGGLLQQTVPEDGSKTYASIQAAINRLAWEDGVWRILSLNDNAHLLPAEEAGAGKDVVTE